MRQVARAFAEYERARLVSKLRHARDRKSEALRKAARPVKGIGRDHARDRNRSRAPGRPHRHHLGQCLRLRHWKGLRPGSSSSAAHKQRGFTVVTKSQIARLSRRIDQVAEQLGLVEPPEYKVWLSFTGASEAAFILRDILTRVTQRADAESYSAVVRQ